MIMKRWMLSLLLVLQALVVGCGGGVVAQTADDPLQPPQARPAQERARIHTELASMYFQEGNVAVALEELRIALAIDRDYASAYNVRGLVHYYLRETEAAESDFRRALRLNEADPEINNNFGWFLCQTRREAESLPYFLRAIKNPLYQTPERAYLNAGQCALRAGDDTAAEDYLQKALRLANGPVPVASVRLSEIALRRGRLDEARRLVAEVLKTSESTVEALAVAIRIERQAGDRNAEAGFLSQLRKRFPESREAKELLKGVGE